MKTVAAGACGAVVGKCSNTPTNVLPAGAHTWKVRAFIGGAWKAFSAPKAFTVTAPSTLPWAGYWASTTGDEFYVKPARNTVANFAIYVSACGSTWKITHTTLLPISNKHFAFGGPFYASGTFTSATRAAGQDGLSGFVLPGCGTFNGGPWSYTATWQNATQPAIVTGVVANILEQIGLPDLALPNPYHVVEMVAP
jgi:hypothetical protein